MKKIIITYSLISAILISALMLMTMPLVLNGTINFDNGMFVGYTTMVISLSMIFFGIKRYRDQQGGTISFVQGLKIGLMIAVVAAVAYAITWEIYFNVGAQDFVEKYTQHQIESMEKAGASAAEIDAAKEEMATFGEWYKNPVIRFGVTLFEILPVGILITLISAALLRRREVLPA